MNEHNDPRHDDEKGEALRFARAFLAAMAVMVAVWALVTLLILAFG